MQNLILKLFIKGHPSSVTIHHVANFDETSAYIWFIGGHRCSGCLNQPVGNHGLGNRLILPGLTLRPPFCGQTVVSKLMGVLIPLIGLSTLG